MIITLTTDIGWEYAAEMKGKIFSINPEAKIVDITHNVMPQNIMQGAFIMYSTAPHFKNAIHIGVVDPGVGTPRKAIIVECNHSYFIGPDNGLLIPAAKKIGIKRIYEIEKKRDVSEVFHGRDIFAPIAAHLSLGRKAKEFGEEIGEFVNLEFEEAIKIGNTTKGKILFIDKFGNIITNIEQSLIEKEEFCVKIGEVEEKVHLRPSYGYVKRGEIVAVISSCDFLEIAKREGDASRHFNAREGGTIEIFL